MCWKGEPGSPGMSGPASITDFETKDGSWKQEQVELQNLCLKIINFMEAHPDIASKVEITKLVIKSSI